MLLLSCSVSAPGGARRPPTLSRPRARGPVRDGRPCATSRASRTSRRTGRGAAQAGAAADRRPERAGSWPSGRWPRPPGGGAGWSPPAAARRPRRTPAGCSRSGRRGSTSRRRGGPGRPGPARAPPAAGAAGRGGGGTRRRRTGWAVRRPSRWRRGRPEGAAGTARWSGARWPACRRAAGWCWCCATTRGWTTPRSAPGWGCRAAAVAADADAGLAALRSILRRRGRPEDLLPAALADPARDLPDAADPVPAAARARSRRTRRRRLLVAGAAVAVLAGWPSAPPSWCRRSTPAPGPAARGRGTARRAGLDRPRPADRGPGPAARRAAGLVGRGAGGAAAGRRRGALRRQPGRRPPGAAAGRRRRRPDLGGRGGWRAWGWRGHDAGGLALRRAEPLGRAVPLLALPAADGAGCGCSRPRTPPTAAACSSATRSCRRTRRCAGSPLDATA